MTWQIRGMYPRGWCWPIPKARDGLDELPLLSSLPKHERLSVRQGLSPHGENRWNYTSWRGGRIEGADMQGGWSKERLLPIRRFLRSARTTTSTPLSEMSSGRLSLSLYHIDRETDEAGRRLKLDELQSFLGLQRLLDMVLALNFSQSQSFLRKVLSGEDTSRR
ncbi:hypothetical protein LZ30DRAFT_318827 [Colletotrichum cereale]|nr:hypothetical protein LZ30DRAFT_318827 [Colletotrichum cereale]